jgi:hypothetical protein
MKRADIWLDGLERDIALKRASEATAPPSHMTLGMAVDRFTGAFRALRSGRAGSQHDAPGPDYGQDMGEPLVLVDIPAVPLGTVNVDTDLFDTLRWDWMLITVQGACAHPMELVPCLHVYSLPIVATIDLSFAHPLYVCDYLQVFVVPAYHPAHLIRVHFPVGFTAASLWISVQRLPPGYPIGQRQTQAQILHSDAIGDQNLLLCHFWDRSARGFLLNAIIDGVANPTTRCCWLDVIPWTGLVGRSLWNVPLGIRSPVNTIARVPQQGPIALWWRTTGAAGPTWSAHVSFCPIYGA